MSVCAEEMGKVWSEKKGLGEESCDGFCKEELDAVLDGLSDYFDVVPGKCKVVCARLLLLMVLKL